MLETNVSGDLMDQSNALHKLMEVADLIRMVEELTNPAAYEKLSSGTMSGMRITLRNARETILSSHDVLAGNMVQRAKVNYEAKSNQNNEVQLLDASPVDSASAARSGVLTDAQRAQLTRRDLRASLEKMVDR